jgi:ankyrin repeat protein
LLLTADELNEQDELTKSTPLHFAIELDRLEWVHLLLQASGTNVDAQDGVGHTPLHVACIRGRRDLAEALIARGANPNVANKAKETPLHCVARTNGTGPLLKLLLGANEVKVDAENAQGQTPLHVALIGECRETVRLLLDAGVTVDLNAADANGRTPLHWAYMLRMRDMVSLLQDRGASEFSRDNEGKTPMQLF